MLVHDWGVAPRELDFIDGWGEVCVPGGGGTGVAPRYIPMI